MDKSCLVSVALFFAGNFLNIISFNEERGYRASGGFNFEEWKTLEPHFIVQTWVWRLLNGTLNSWANLLNSFAWFSLVIPIVQVAWVLSRKGKRRVGMHSYLVFLVLGGCFSEFTSRLITTGLEDVTRYIVMNFNLDDWETSFTGDIDGMGWRVIEMVHLYTRGLLLWIDSFEWIILFQVLIIIHISLRSEPKENKTFSPSFGYYGLLIAILCIVDFVTSVLRMVSWRKWAIATFMIAFINRLILIPIWLIVLGRQLPQAVEKYINEISSSTPSANRTAPNNNNNNNDPNTEDVDDGIVVETLDADSERVIS